MLLEGGGIQWLIHALTFIAFFKRKIQSIAVFNKILHLQSKAIKHMGSGSHTG